MSTTIDYIIWNADPELINILGRSVRYYGLLFALAFVASWQVMNFIYKKEGRPSRDVDRLTLYIILGTVLGARLGHCLFYEPEKYLSNPIDILKIWEGGLASHGAAVGILLATYFYIRKMRSQGYTFWWLIDRLVIVVALSGAFIRMGNYMNSEIVGLPSEDGGGVVFARSLDEMLTSYVQIDEVSFTKAEAFEHQVEGTQPIRLTIEVNKAENITAEALGNFVESTLVSQVTFDPRVSSHFRLRSDVSPKYEVEDRGGYFEVWLWIGGVARHPAQLYEAISSLILALLFFFLWFRFRQKLKPGFAFGLFLVLLFSLRFAYEFLKENQVDFENEMALNMGQLLSVPLVLAGFVIMIWSLKRKSA